MLKEKDDMKKYLEISNMAQVILVKQQMLYEQQKLVKFEAYFLRREKYSPSTQNQVLEDKIDELEAQQDAKEDVTLQLEECDAPIISLILSFL